ncbi:hypothetical protein ACS7SF_15270 [Ralstonia sp. 25C]|uniref:hypothetical protein n=1 Tax=Ralstonia sp. 25C TaxID=3447363 RepID=UPI003F7559C9
MPTDLSPPRPPWITFPQLQPGELALHVQQGIAETWFDQEWRPYWALLTPEQKKRYLDDWQASPEWRDAIAFVFDNFSDLDIELDARESEAYLKAQREHSETKKRSLFARLFKR